MLGRDLGWQLPSTTSRSLGWTLRLKDLLEHSAETFSQDQPQHWLANVPLHQS